ncbi:MAG: ABC-type sugar transport system periplasmic component-like protein [Blastococcus sp.]|jgi:ribose transport system substrate-binding protein|nr:ABC-type sugar transport system periplasmic component-like protein [Blastococcus sp.]
MSHRNRGLRPFALAALVASLTLAACSTGSGSGSSASGGSTSGGGSADAVSAEVTANVEKYQALPEFTPPGDPIDPSPLKGKSMFLIPLAPNPFNENIQDTMKSIADKVGMKFTLYPNQGKASEWVQGMNAALTAKPDIIVLSTAPDPRVLQPQLDQAKKAGIPVLVTHFYDDSSPQPPDCDGCAAGVTGLVTAPFNVAGKAAADWIIKDSGGTGNVLVIGAADILPSPATVDVVTKELAEACDGCKSTVVNIPVADWNTKVQGEVQAALNRDPSIDYVYPLYDAMVAGVVPAVQTTGKTGKVKVVSYNGSPYALKYIQDGDIVAMNVGEDTVGIGYASMDQAFRILLGQPTVDERTPIRIWDDSNVDDSGTPPVVGKGYGTALSEGYTKLWGMD